VRNHSLNILRKEKIETIELDEELIFSDEPLVDEQVISQDEQDQLVHLIRSLNPVMREMLEYKYILGYSNKDIAEELGISQTAVSSRIERAKKALRKKLEERGVLDNE